MMFWQQQIQNLTMIDLVIWPKKKDKIKRITICWGLNSNILFFKDKIKINVIFKELNQ